MGKVWHYPQFVRRFHTSTPLRSVELSKEWQGVLNRGKVRQYPDFVRLFHTSTPLRSVELSKERQRFRDQGKSVTLSWLCQTFPHFYTSEKYRNKDEKGKLGSCGQCWTGQELLDICGWFDSDADLNFSWTKFKRRKMLTLVKLLKKIRYNNSCIRFGASLFQAFG